MAEAKEQTNNPAEWAGFKAPRGYELGWKVVRPDGRTYNNYQWPFKGRVVADPGGREFTTIGPCPLFEGDGLCIANTWSGAASGGIPAVTGLALAYKRPHVLAESSEKLRVSECRVLGMMDLQRLIREGHASWADLRGADLSGANIRAADLPAADLRGADLSGANIRAADLRGADLSGANIRAADLRGADLRWADLYGADLRGADLYGAMNKDLAHGLQS